MNDLDTKNEEPILPALDDLKSKKPSSSAIAAAMAPKLELEGALNGGSPGAVSEATLSERLDQLREAGEVIECDSDLNDIFMFVQEDIPLTKKSLLKFFPKAKALVITHEQLLQMEANSHDYHLSYIVTSGKRIYLHADFMEEDHPVIIFVEDLSD